MSPPRSSSRPENVQHAFFVCVCRLVHLCELGACDESYTNNVVGQKKSAKPKGTTQTSAAAPTLRQASNQLANSEMDKCSRIQPHACTHNTNASIQFVRLTCSLDREEAHTRVRVSACERQKRHDFWGVRAQSSRRARDRHAFKCESDCV